MERRNPGRESPRLRQVAMKLGLTVSSEEHPPGRIFEVARMAEDSGFDFVSVSDHYHHPR